MIDEDANPFARIRAGVEMQRAANAPETEAAWRERAMFALVEIIAKIDQLTLGYPSILDGINQIGRNHADASSYQTNLLHSTQDQFTAIERRLSAIETAMMNPSRSTTLSTPITDQVLSDAKTRAALRDYALEVRRLASSGAWTKPSHAFETVVGEGWGIGGGGGGASRHASGCAVHNQPAYPAGACDCGAEIQLTREETERLAQMKAGY